MCVLGTCVMTCHSQCVRDTRPVYVCSRNMCDDLSQCVRDTRPVYMCSRNMCDDLSQSVCMRYKACVRVF